MSPIVHVDTSNVGRVVAEAAAVLAASGLIVMPTDTVYGLACAATAEAAGKIFTVKARDRGKPLPVLINGLEQLAVVAREIPEKLIDLNRAYWPGPLTVIVKKTPSLPEEITGGHDTVGVRVPNHPVALELLRVYGKPIVATSANMSGEAAATSIDGIDASILECVEMVLDSGECPIQEASTVLDLSGEAPCILRSGPISSEELFRILRSEVL